LKTQNARLFLNERSGQPQLPGSKNPGHGQNATGF
jgi:hypothetical protein